jgi:hypothetical protein
MVYPQLQSSRICKYLTGGIMLGSNRFIKWELVVSCLLLSGCGYPLKVDKDKKTVHVNYEKIHNSVICHVIEAWKNERSYHHRRLDTDGTNWFTDLEIRHTRTGSAGISSKGDHTRVLGSWTRVFNVSLGPSVSNKYEMVSNTKFNVPGSVFTRKSLDGNYPNEQMVLKEEVASVCDDKYVNISQLGIVPHFDRFVRGYDPEHNNDEQKYTNLIFESTGKLVASIGGSFLYKLVPYSALFPPEASYTDRIKIVIVITRKPLNPKKKTIKPALVKISNLGSLRRVTIVNVAELACKIKYPEANQDEAFDKCMGKEKPVRSTGLRSIIKTPESKLRSTRPAVRRLPTKKAIIADTNRETKRRLFEQSVDEVIDQRRD